MTKARKLRNALIVSNYYYILVTIFLFFSLLSPFAIMEASSSQPGKFGVDLLNSFNVEYPTESDCEKYRQNVVGWLIAWAPQFRTNLAIDKIIDVESPFVLEVDTLPARCDFQKLPAGEIVDIRRGTK